MKLTALDLVCAYNYLNSHPPFTKWNLPSHDRIRFVVKRSLMQMGEYDVDPHTIIVSSKTNENLQQVLETVAHEMVHMACEIKDYYKHPDHDYHFQRLAKQVCRQFGWPIKDF